MKGDLGCRFWKTRRGVVLVDVVDTGICSRPHFLLEGLRPGLVLKEIHTADGHERNLTGEDRSYHQIVQIISMSLRPMVLCFDPDPTSIDFTFEVPMLELGSGIVGLGERLTRKAASTTLAVTEIANSTVPGSAPLTTMQSVDDGQFNIVEALGLSLSEEDSAVWDGHNWRIRVENVKPDGLVGQFNKEHEYDFVYPGMLLCSVHSPMLEHTELAGVNLKDVITLLHKAAPGDYLEKEIGGKVQKFNGKSVTLGFRFPSRVGSR